MTRRLAGLDADGWLAGARQVRSPFCNARPSGVAIELVVVHSISLPPGVFGGDQIERLFTGRLDPAAHPYFEALRGLEVSAHFLVHRDARLTQFVGCSQRAWHAGASRWRGSEGCNDFSVGIELEGLEGGSFEPAQYERLAQVLRAVARRHPIAEVLGHEHVAPGRKADPGPGFDWQRLAAACPARPDWFAQALRLSAGNSG